MRYQAAMLFNMKYNDQAVTKKCKPYKVDKQYINPMRLMFRAGLIDRYLIFSLILRDVLF
jgi:hypothetical protein